MSGFVEPSALWFFYETCFSPLARLASKLDRICDTGIPSTPINIDVNGTMLQGREGD